MKRLILSIIILAALAFSFSIVDASGRNVTISHYPPSRVVALTPALSEAVCLINCTKLVGTVQPVTWPPELVQLVKEGKVIVVGQFWNPNVEEIAKLKPDVILADMGSDWRLYGTLKDVGSPIVFVKGGICPTVSCVANDMILVGKVLGNETAGRTIASWILGNLSEVSNLTKNNTVIKTMILFYPFTWGIYAVGNGTFINDLVEHLNAVNVFKQFKGWPRIPKELVSSKRVDVLLLLAGYKLDLKKVKEDVKALGVKARWVCVIYGKGADIVERPGPRLSKAPWLLYEALWKHSTDTSNGVYCWR